MRFLADESCDFSVVRALRSADHDVVAIAEVSSREEDEDVVLVQTCARLQNRHR
jgi:Domain of unknown function (DUF5615)